MHILETCYQGTISFHSNRFPDSPNRIHGSLNRAILIINMDRLTPEEEKSILRKILDVTDIPLERAIASGSYGTIHPLENDERKVAKIIIMDTIHDAYRAF